MKRWVFNLAAASSLLTLAAWVIVWLSHSTTHREWDLWSLPHANGSAYAAAMPDRYGVGFVWVDPAVPPRPAPSTFNHSLGFHFQRFVSSLGLMTIVVIPSWFAVPALAALPGYWLWSRCTSKLGRVGLCAHCGYDLRATPQRCPECGMGVSSRVKAR